MKRVLIIGNDPIRFCRHIAIGLTNTGEYSVTIASTLQASHEDLNDKTFNFVRIPSLDLNTYDSLHLLKSLFHLRFWISLFAVNDKYSNLTFRNRVRNSIRMSIVGAYYKKLFESFDIINFHNINSYATELFHLTPSTSKVIASIWGSDVMQSNIDNYYNQWLFFKHCSAITVTSFELQEIVLSKYGRNLGNKIFHTYYGLSENFFERAKNINSQVAKEFICNKFSIPKADLLVSIGNNRNRINNHIEILKSLNELSFELKSKITFIIPFTYGFKNYESYMNECKEICKINDLEFRFIEDYLEQSEYLKLQKSIDISISCGSSDAFSAYVGEMLFLGNSVIAGAWLPYRTWLDRGVFLKSAQSIADVPNLIMEFSELKANDREKLIQNAEIVYNLLQTENVIKGWVKVFNQVRL